MWFVHTLEKLKEKIKFETDFEKIYVFFSSTLTIPLLPNKLNAHISPPAISFRCNCLINASSQAMVSSMLDVQLQVLEQHSPCPR